MKSHPVAVSVLLATAVSELLLVVGGSAGLAGLLYLLVIPGLATTLHMGPMELEARVLLALVASIVIGTVVSVGLLLTDSWAPDTGFHIIAGAASALAATSFRRAFAPSRPALRPETPATSS